MRKFLTIAVLVNLAICCGFSQKFPLDANGEVVYQEIIEVDSLKKEEAYQNGLSWVNSLKDEQVVLARRDSLEGNLSGHSSFSVYDQSGVFKKLSGKISYTFSIDVKDGKYRYTFSDFVFHYYKQDRSYKLVDTGKTKNLKESEAKGWQKLWDKHRINANKEMSDNINSLKAIMKKVPVIRNGKPKEKKVEW